MEKRISIKAATENSGEPFHTVYQAQDHTAPEVAILGYDGKGDDSAFLITVAYEGDGAFSIRSIKGSRITIRGGRVRQPLIVK
jgi:hypothetical protein